MYGSHHYPAVMQGNAFLDPRGKSDFDAGLLFFAAMSRMYPGLKWSDLSRPQFMAGWWTNLKKAATSVRKGIGDTLSDTIGFIGRKGGEAVRLAADPDVAGAVSRAGAAYATGGASEGASGIMGALSNIFTPDGRKAVEIAGASYKQNFGGVPPAVWIGGGAGLLVLVVLLTRK